MADLSYRPEILARSREGDAFRFQLRIPAELAYFHGHFPGFPILPGVVQIHWAASLFLDLHAVPLVFRRMENIKFKRLILPEMRVELRLAYDDARRRLTFRYLAPDGETSSGRMYWEVA